MDSLPRVSQQRVAEDVLAAVTPYAGIAVVWEDLICKEEHARGTAINGAGSLRHTFVSIGLCGHFGFSSITEYMITSKGGR